MKRLKMENHIVCSKNEVDRIEIIISEDMTVLNREP
jgi:hypothetical protein